MTDSSNARSKAEACIRLASVADHARTVELFRQLANEYLAEAGIDATDADEAERPVSAVAWAIADIQAMAGASLDTTIQAPTIAATAAETRPDAIDPQAELAPSLVPGSDSEQFLARFKALRASAEI
jgi:hypothetical protein